MGGCWETGLSANAPIEAVFLDSESHDPLVCFVIDLYARDGSRPQSLEESLARKGDLIFGNQTYQRLQALVRESELRAQLAHLMEQLPKQRRKRAGGVPLNPRPPQAHILHLSYRASPDEAGPERPYDLSPASVDLRWRAGALDMAEALRVLAQASGLRKPSG